MTTRLLHVFTAPASLRFLRGQTHFFARHGFDVHVASAEGDEMCSGMMEADALGAEFHAYPVARSMSPGRDIVALTSLASVVRRVRPELVLGHTPKGGLLGMTAATLAGVGARVYHMHGLPLETSRGLTQHLLTQAERVSCALARTTICVSESVRRAALERRLAPADALEVVAHGSINGVDRDLFDFARHEAAGRALRRQLGIPENATLFGFVGRLSVDKGVADLLDAWERISERAQDVHLLLVGNADARQPLPPEIAQRLSGSPRLHRLEFTESIQRVYAAIDVLVLPSYREGFPLTPLEASAMGRPVVATRVTGCIDAVVDGVTGTLVPPRDPRRLAQAMLDYRSPQIRAARGDAARERAHRSFGPETVWREHLAVYERVIGAFA